MSHSSDSPPYHIPSSTFSPPPLRMHTQPPPPFLHHTHTLPSYTSPLPYSLSPPTLTGSPTVTTPCSFTTFGCRNCPMMAASCRNLILSSSVIFGFSVFTATSIVPVDSCHSPLFTVPNCPAPKCSTILCKRTDYTVTTVYSSSHNGI